MSISNYTELKTAITNTLHRDDLGDYVADFITLAESDINALAQFRAGETTAAVTMTSGQAYSSLPTGFVEVVDFYYKASVDDINDQLKKLTVPQMQMLRDDSISGRPRYYSITDVILWEQKPDAAYAPEMRYIKKWDIASDTTNWLLTNHPGLYLYGALVHSAPFLKNDARIVTWRSLFEAKMNELNQLSSRQRLSTLRVDPALTGSGGFDIYSGE